MLPNIRLWLKSFSLLSLLFCGSAPAETLEILNSPETGEPGKFAEQEIRRAAEAQGIETDRCAKAIRVELTIVEAGTAQGYRIDVKNDDGQRVITVQGADQVGAMYGGLHITEAIHMGQLDSLKNSEHKPHIERRGIKFNIPLDLRTRLNARQPMTETTPLEIATALDGAAAETFAAIAELRNNAGADRELQKAIHDCEALGWLGRYYAAKIRGACALALFDSTGDSFEHDVALRHLNDALSHWKAYAAIRDAHYVPALYNRVGYVDVTALTEKVAADIDIARNWNPDSLKDDGKRSGSEKGFRQ